MVRQRKCVWIRTSLLLIYGSWAVKMLLHPQHWQLCPAGITTEMSPLIKTLQCISKALPRWETTGGAGQGSKISALGSVEVRAENLTMLDRKNYPNTHYWLLNNRPSLSFCCWHPFRMIKSVEEPLPAWGTAQLIPNNRSRGNNNQLTLLGCFHVLVILIQRRVYCGKWPSNFKALLQSLQQLLLGQMRKWSPTSYGAQCYSSLQISLKWGGMGTGLEHHLGFYLHPYKRIFSLLSIVCSGIFGIYLCYSGKKKKNNQPSFGFSPIKDKKNP